MQVDLTAIKTTFSNYFTTTTSLTNVNQNFKFYYYFIPLGVGNQSWEEEQSVEVINIFDNLFSDKKFLLDNHFITEPQYNDPFFIYSSEKDIAEFEIDFSTYNLINHVKDGIVDIKKLNYPPVGYYLGFRPNMKKSSDNFIYKGVVDGTERVIRGTKIFDTTGDDYVFLKINDWGYIDFFGQKMFAKILLTSNLGNPKIDDYVNKEYRFRQPINISKLDVELVDYLGNTIELGGFDWSFTLELKQIINSIEKTSIERSSVVFSNIYKS